MPEPLPSYRTDHSALSQGLSRVTTKAFPRCGKAHMTPRKRLSGSTGKAQANHRIPHHTDTQRLGITAKKTTYFHQENLMDEKKVLSRSMLRIIMHLQPITCIYIYKNRRQRRVRRILTRIGHRSSYVFRIGVGQIGCLPYRICGGRHREEAQDKMKATVRKMDEEPVMHTDTPALFFLNLQTVM